MKSPVLVLGCGNPLSGDDGVGDEVIASLRAFPLPPGTRLDSVGSDAHRLPLLWEGEPRVWLVDAVIRGREPGTIHVIGHSELLSLRQAHASVHRLSLPEAMRWIALAHPEMAHVEYSLWGVEPGRVGGGEGLSPAVSAAVPRLAARMIRELGGA